MRRYLTPFLMLCLVGFTARLGYQMARSPVLPQFAEELTANAFLIGLIISASTITGVFLKFPAGALSDVLGRRRMLLLGAAFFAFPPFLYMLVKEAYTLLILRFVHGGATAIFSPVASAAVADLFREGRGEKLGWFASANEMGSAFGPLIGGVILGSAVAGSLFMSSFQLVYLIVGVLGALTFLLVVWLPIGQPATIEVEEALVPESDPASSLATPPKESRWQQVRQGMWEVVSNRDILITSSVESAMFLGVGALLGFLPLYAKNILGLDGGYLGVLIGAPLVMAMVGKPVAGRVSDRIGRKPVILVGLALCVVMLPLIFLTTTFIGLLVEGAIFGLGMAIVTPSTTALVADLCKAGNYGAALGVFGTIWDVGEALGPITAGAIISGVGNLETASAYLVAFSVIAVALVLAGLIFSVSVKEPEAVVATA